jgi:hypothetical protein
MDTELKEMEARVIERAKFWDGYINTLIRLRDGGIRAADKSSAWKPNPAESLLRDGLQQAIDAAMLLQQDELSQCFMLAGVGGERAAEYAKGRAKAILGAKGMEFASVMGWIPTYWSE